MKKLFIFTLFLFLSQMIFATTNFVSLDGNHVSPFESWENAATNIQHGVDVASPDNLVLISNGYYVIFPTITVTKKITLRSFDGVDSVILDGAFGSANQFTNRILTIKNGAVCDGLTIINGGFDLSGLNQNGGGINCSNATVINCSIKNCNLPREPAQYGAGIFATASLISNCFFNNNYASLGFLAHDNISGGGIGCRNSEIVDCTFSSNIAFAGAAVYAMGNSMVRNSLFINNSNFFKDVSVAYSHASVISNCTFKNNIGGVALNDAKIFDSTIINNYLSMRGGGLKMFGNSLCERCIVTNNEAVTGGGIYIFENGIIRNSLIAGNSANAYFWPPMDLPPLSDRTGGGMFVEGDATIENCTIVKNIVVNKSSRAGGIYLKSTFAPAEDYIIQNSIVFDNSGQNISDNMPDATIRYNCAESWTDITDGNISNSPIFVDFDSDNFHLKLASPCVNAGTNAFVSGEFDLDGKSRIFNEKVDMGCYETVPEPGLFIYFIAVWLVRKLILSTK